MKYVLDSFEKLLNTEAIKNTTVAPYISPHFTPLAIYTAPTTHYHSVKAFVIGKSYYFHNVIMNCSVSLLPAKESFILHSSVCVYSSVVKAARERESRLRWQMLQE